ncbi:MAG: sodium-translocating pyrophosphatase [Spirochaetes bacterium]|jgi:K(+)-stimulated pyrophosphate-energized sodium pump|nr:sodium-translocating pyrophosphatase [Spirochaetota bacterium]
MDSLLLYFPLGAGVLSLLFAFYRVLWVGKQNPGSETLKEISHAIRSGAFAFLKREYKVLAIIVACVAILLVIGEHGATRLVAVSFIVGALLSGTAGLIGMHAATLANSRTAHSAKTGLASALTVAFTGGSVMGLSVVGLSIIGLSGLLLIYTAIFGFEIMTLKDTVLPIINGYSLGASSVALFARVGGGIFTKAADVGADLVGKVEAGIPEDDPRNPAVIADNVGDNVGDVAGLGSDLCESYIGSIIGAMVLGGAALSVRLVVLPLIIAAIGIIMSIIGMFFVRTKEGGNPQNALNFGTIGASVLMLIFTFPAVWYLAPRTFSYENISYSSMGIIIAIIAGLICGVLIGMVTEYYTADNRKPVINIARASTTGAATNILGGLQVGMVATGMPVILLAAAIMVAYQAAGLYGIAIASMGMLATTGIQLAVDAYGPIADNAGGIAEMAAMEPEVRERTDKLDAVGNTTAAIGKGFAIGSATLTALALFVAYKETVGLTMIDATRPRVLVGLLMGGMLPYVFSSFLIGSVGKAAFSMIEEVRRQFRTIEGLLAGKAKPDYVKCVDIATKAAIREMIVPGVLAVLVPVVVGFFGGAEMLGGVLVGVMISGVMLALFMANSGGAWDNAKKHIEGGAFGGKGSDAHKASVIGDTVGDPFKDTAGPSMDILIKLMSVVSLVIAPIISR